MVRIALLLKNEMCVWLRTFDNIKGYQLLLTAIIMVMITIKITIITTTTIVIR